MKDGDKTKVERIKDLKTLRKKRRESAVNNITKRKQAEEKLQDSEEYLKILFDYAPDAYYISDLKGNFVDGNKVAERVIGYKKEELIGKSFLKLKLLTLADIPKAVKTLTKNIMGQATGPDEFVLNRKDNIKVTVEISTYPVKIKGRALVLGLARDVTERKKMEQKMRESGQLYHSLFENMLNGLAYCQMHFDDHDRPYDFTYLSVNKAFGTLTGLRNVVGKKASEVIPGIQESDSELFKIYGRVSTTGKPEHFEMFVSSLQMWFWVSVYSLKRGYFVSVFDVITERKQAEEELEKLAKFPAENPYPVLRISKNGTVLYHNYASESLLKQWHYQEGKPLQDRWCQLVLDALHNDDIKNVETEIGDKVIFLTFAPIINKGFVNVYGLDITERKQAEEKLKNTLDATIETMSKIVEVKDPYTAGHQLRVSQLTTAIAKELNLSQDKIEGIRIASLIHDIGKISVPTEILSKTTTLSDIEFSLIKGHSQIGYDILKSIDFSYPVANIILQHHERIDSSGYPNHLKGDQVLLEACIIGVADVVEAMSSHRPYRPSLGIDAALEEISKNRGILYDPEVVDVCLKLLKEKEFKFDESASN